MEEKFESYKFGSVTTKMQEAGARDQQICQTSWKVRKSSPPKTQKAWRPSLPPSFPCFSNANLTKQSLSLTRNNDCQTHSTHNSYLLALHALGKERFHKFLKKFLGWKSFGEERRTDCFFLVLVRCKLFSKIFIHPSSFSVITPL